jgi:hypothetical protein
MLFHLTTEDDIRVIHEQEPAETDAGASTFASEQQFTKLARKCPLLRMRARLSSSAFLCASADINTSLCSEYINASTSNTTTKTCGHERLFP